METVSDTLRFRLPGTLQLDEQVALLEVNTTLCPDHISCIELVLTCGSLSSDAYPTSILASTALWTPT